jgi:ABC-type Fe3+ transport system permease subunit
MRTGTRRIARRSLIVTFVLGLPAITVLTTLAVAHHDARAARQAAALALLLIAATWIDHLIAHRSDGRQIPLDDDHQHDD